MHSEGRDRVLTRFRKDKGQIAQFVTTENGNMKLDAQGNLIPRLWEDFMEGFVEHQAVFKGRPYYTVICHNEHYVLLKIDPEQKEFTIIDSLREGYEQDLGKVNEYKRLYSLEYPEFANHTIQIKHILCQPSGSLDCGLHVIFNYILDLNGDDGKQSKVGFVPQEEMRVDGIQFNLSQAEELLGAQYDPFEHLNVELTAKEQQLQQDIFLAESVVNPAPLAHFIRNCKQKDLESVQKEMSLAQDEGHPLHHIHQLMFQHFSDNVKYDLTAADDVESWLQSAATQGEELEVGLHIYPYVLELNQLSLQPEKVVTKVGLATDPEMKSSVPTEEKGLSKYAVLTLASILFAALIGLMTGSILSALGLMMTVQVGYFLLFRTPTDVKLSEPPEPIPAQQIQCHRSAEKSDVLEPSLKVVLGQCARKRGLGGCSLLVSTGRGPSGH